MSDLQQIILGTSSEQLWLLMWVEVLVSLPPLSQVCHGHIIEKATTILQLNIEC